MTWGKPLIKVLLNTVLADSFNIVFKISSKPFTPEASIGCC
jgi:hypothetical protein